MSSILKVDEIQDTSGNNIINESSDTITIGASGDTVNVVGTLQNNGSAISVASLSTASGSAPSYSARAWVKFDGSGTVSIGGSGNVSSITDNGTGDYTANFTTAMADVNYSAVGSAQSRSIGYDLGYTTSSMRVQSRRTDDFALADSPAVNLAIFR